MDIKVFIEYKIISEKRESFLLLLPDLKRYTEEQGARQYNIYEGVDQPNLVVEEFFVKDIEHYQMIKKQRHDADAPLWAKLGDHIDGAGKQHIWAFHEIIG